MDNAATSYPKPECVYTAVDDFNRHMGGNPGRGSSQRTLRAGAVLLEAREALAELFNVKDSSRIAFTLNITQALNLGLKGLLKPGDHVITTSMEHNAVARPLFVMQSQGIEWTRVQCAGDGSLDPHEVGKAIRPNTRLICMLHASNLCGTIMPVTEIGRIAQQNNILFMVDSAQTAGVLDIDVVRDNIDILAFTGHKGLLGPQGTGGIYLHPRILINPLLQGGTGSLSESLEQPLCMPDILESGTANTPGIAGLKAGVAYIREYGRENIRAHEQRLTSLLLDGLREIKGVRIFGPADSERQTAVIAFNIEGLDCGDLGFSLDYEYGIITRTGLHCAPLAHQTLGTFESGTCRLSPGLFNTETEICQVIEAVHSISRQCS